MSLLDTLDDNAKRAVLAASALETIFLLIVLLLPWLGWVLVIVFAGLAGFMSWHLFGDKIKPYFSKKKVSKK